MQGNAVEEAVLLKKDYSGLKPPIESRLKEFGAVWKLGNDESIFKELVFCLFTPQSKARSCWAAVERLCESDILSHGSAGEISACMSGVRFHHTKARRIVGARKHMNGLKARLAAFQSPKEAREWLVANVIGMGYKEASHFLRNIGMGRDLAILDRHILKNLVLLGVIPELPKSISSRKYLDIEAKVAAFCRETGIPMDHLDMLLWCRETGEVFK